MPDEKSKKVDYDLLLGELNNLVEHDNDQPIIHSEDLIDDPLSIYRHALKRLIRPNILAESGPYKAICLKSFFLPSNAKNQFSLFGFEDKPVYNKIACYARIPEVHSILPNPFLVTDPIKRFKIIQMHPMFISEQISSEADESIFPAYGAIIEVDFEDKKNKKHGIFKRTIVPSPSGGDDGLDPDLQGSSRTFKAGSTITSLGEITNLASDPLGALGCDPKQRNKFANAKFSDKQLLEDGWKMLNPFFPDNAVMTSGFRTPQDQIRIITDMAATRGFIGPGYPTWREKIVALKASGVKIANPENTAKSGHFAGNAFDVSGNGLRSLPEAERRTWLLRVAEVAQYLSEDEFFPVEIEKIIVEFVNNAVHIEIKSAIFDSDALYDRFLLLNPNCDVGRLQTSIDESSAVTALMESDSFSADPEVPPNGIHDADSSPI